MVSGAIQASAIIALQWFSWIITMIALVLTIRISLKDKDRARTTTQVFFRKRNYTRLFYMYRCKNKSL
jgi:hypothetical protein